MTKKVLRVFDGAVALITGGASGIGRTIGEALAKKGCDVVLADLQEGLASEAAEYIRSFGGKASAMKLDVTDYSTFRKSVQDLVHSKGRLDYLFNNAGVGVCSGAHIQTIHHWNRILDVNLLGVVHGINAAYQIMLNQGFGHIINTASIAGIVPSPGVISYAASKNGVFGLSRALRIEAALKNIFVSVLCPGVIRTPFLTGENEGKLFLDSLMEKPKGLCVQLTPMDPIQFARKVLKAISKNKAIIIYPKWWRILWWIGRVFPTTGFMTEDSGNRCTLTFFPPFVKVGCQGSYIPKLKNGQSAFDGTVAFITVGTTNIGKVLGEVLAEKGCDVILAGMQQDLINKTVENIRANGGKATSVKLDITDYEAVLKTIQNLAQQKGRLDYLFNNTDVGFIGSYNNHTIRHWERVLDVNVRGVVHCINTTYPIMIKQGFGHIVNIASMAGLLPIPEIIPYTTAKHAVVGLSGSLRIEGSIKNVRVSVLCPGLSRTFNYINGEYGNLMGDITKEKQEESSNQLRPMISKHFARKILKAILKNKAIIIYPNWWRIKWWLYRFFSFHRF